jgi:glyoxylase-like metal-dependent hydrolase (beta-lactamase superfamily II)
MQEFFADMIIPINFEYYCVFAVKGNKTIIVDAGSAGYGRRIFSLIHEKGIDKNDISLILITHGHSDHFGGANELRKLTGAPVAVHQADAEWLRKGTNPDVVITSEVSGYVKKFISEKASKVTLEGLEPDILLDGDMSLEQYGVDAQLICTPGHTAGSVSIVTSNHEAVAGDLVMGRLVNQLQPRWPFFADSLEDVKKSLETLLSMGVELFYTGHGGPFPRRTIERLLLSGIK